MTVRSEDVLKVSRVCGSTPNWLIARAASALAVLLPVLLGMGLTLWITRPGVGIEPDSVVYISAARSLLQGRGYAGPLQDGAIGPITHFPPGFSLALAALGSFGLEPAIGARWLNAALLGATAGLVAFLAFLYSRSRIAALLSGLLAACMTDMLGIHTMALSEPLYLFWSALALALLATYLIRPRIGVLVAAALLSGIAFLDRFAGIALVLTGTIALLLWTDSSRWARMRAATLFVTLSCSPMALWMAGNSMRHLNGTDRTLLYHPITMRHVGSGIDTISAWLFLDRFPREVGVFGIGLVGLMGLIRLRAGWTRRPDRDRGVALLTRLLGTSVAAYLLVLVATILWIDWDVIPDSRYLAPVLLAVILMMAIHMARLLGSQRTSPRAARGVALAVVLFTGGHLARGVVWARAAAMDGQGFAGVDWTNSEVMDRIREMPANAYIATNRPDALYYHSGRRTYRIPQQWNPNTQERNGKFESEIEEMGRELAERRGVLAFFAESDDGMPSEEEVKRRVPLQLEVEEESGRLYTTAKSPAARGR